MLSNFSVITPNYNMGKYLVETIESVLINLKPDDEYFIIDGGSTDNSLEIIQNYQDRITGWISEKDHGYADALAKGFAKTTGAFQCWVNCGDLLLPNALEKAKSLLITNKIDLVYGDAIDIDDNGKILWISSANFQPLRQYMLYGSWTPWQISCFWKQSAYEQCNGINADVKLAADYDLFLRMTRQAKTKYFSVSFGAHRHHEGQLSISHQSTYKSEKNLIRSNERSFDTVPINVFASAYYWLATRLKSRFSCHSPLSRIWMNKQFSEIKNVV